MKVISVDSFSCHCMKFTCDMSVFMSCVAANPSLLVKEFILCLYQTNEPETHILSSDVERRKEKKVQKI